MKWLHFTYHGFFILLQAYADALLVIPKILAQNSGYDPQETIVKLQVIKSEKISTNYLKIYPSFELKSLKEVCCATKKFTRVRLLLKTAELLSSLYQAIMRQ